MSLETQLTLWIVLWMLGAAFSLMVRARYAGRQAGLVWAYMANLWLLHWPAAVLYALPWYSGFEISTVLAGFVQSTYGILAFGFGAAVLGPLVVSTLANPHHGPTTPPDPLLPRSYLIVGVLSYLIAVPLASRIATVGALATSATQLVIVGICLSCWHGWYAKKRGMYWRALLIASTLPLVTILGQGFLGYGAGAVIVVLAFNASFVRPKWKVAVAGVIITYLGFSGYVTYMRDRAEIRRIVWGGSTLTTRFTSVLGTVRKSEFFNPRDAAHLQRIDTRLNQNYLVGASVEMLTSGARDYANGETVIQAAQSLVPRAIWADKPSFAGSGDIVSNYTGISFAAGTSVGVGQVMEFFVNFGTIGVLIGFMLLGTMIAIFDTWAAERLWAGDWERFALWFLAGTGFLQAGGSLVEVASTVAAGLVAVWMVNRYLIPLIHRWRADSAFASKQVSAAGRRV